MKLGGGREAAATGTIAGLGVATAPPLHRAAAAAAPTNPAIQGIAIAQIAPVDNPLLLLDLKIIV